MHRRRKAKKNGAQGPVQTLAGPVLTAANCSALRTVDHRCSDFAGRLGKSRP